MENKEAAPPSTPFYNQNLDLPDWNEGLKVLSPNLPRHTPARMPWKMGPPQRTPQAKKPNMRTPAMAASAQRLACGPTPANTPVQGANSKTPALSSFPNALTAEFWLTRAKAKENEGDILGAMALLENALSRNARPSSPLIKEASRLQARSQKQAAAAQQPMHIKLWSSLRPNTADKEKKKTLRFAGQVDVDGTTAIQHLARGDAQEQVTDSMAGAAKALQPQELDALEADKSKERTPHVRFCTPAPEGTRRPKSPMHSRSSNAGSTPFHSSGSRQRMSDFSDDSDDADISESGSPTTVSRRLLEPVLMETIRNMNACNPSMDKECFGKEAEMHEEANEDGTADSHMSESDCMGGMHRYMLESEMSPTSGAIKVPFEDVSSHTMQAADASTPRGLAASPLSDTEEADDGRAFEDKFTFDSLVPAATPDLNLQATPALRARPAVLPQGNSTPSVCINPLYSSANTPSTANSDAPNTAAYTPAVPADPMFFATPVTPASSAAPLLSAFAAKSLFSAAPVIEEEPEEDAQLEVEPVSDVTEEQPDAQGDENDAAAALSASPAAGSVSEDGVVAGQSLVSFENHTDEVVHSSSTPAAAASTEAAEGSVTIGAAELTGGAEVFATSEAAGSEEASLEVPGSPVTQQPALTRPEAAAARRAFPRTPASAVRRSRPDADDAPTPIRNPLRVATPARARPRVSASEIRSLLQDPHAPSPAQAAAMGSRNALSPMRAAPKLRSGLGHTQLVTPKRRSARKPAAAAPQSTGKMLAAAGFAYAPNAALAGRLAAAADGRPILGDAMDADLLAAMDEVGGSEGSPVILDASKLEELASVMGAVSLSPTLEVACHSHSTTPEPHKSLQSAAKPSADKAGDDNTETTPIAQLAAPCLTVRVTRSALRKSQPPRPAAAAGAAAAGGAKPIEEGLESEDEGTPSFKEASRPQSSRVTRSAAKAAPQTPAAADSAESKVPTEGEDASSKGPKQLSPTERTIRQGLRRSTRLA